jgi:hypothetical protein
LPSLTGVNTAAAKAGLFTRVSVAVRAVGGAQAGVQVSQHQLIARPRVHEVGADGHRLAQLPLVSGGELIRVGNRAIWVVDRHVSGVLDPRAGWIPLRQERAVHRGSACQHGFDGRRRWTARVGVVGGEEHLERIREDARGQDGEISSKCVLS